MDSDVDHLYDFVTSRNISEALAACPPEHQPRAKLDSKTKRNKRAFIKALLNEGEYWFSKLQEIAEENEKEQIRKEQETRERRAEKARRIRQEAREAALTGEFLDLPSPDEQLNAYTRFYAATSNEALKQLICAVCARMLNAIDAGIVPLNVVDIPNRNRLQPNIPHAAHHLTNGCLLEAKGCFQDGSETVANICRECLYDLQAGLMIN